MITSFIHKLNSDSMHLSLRHTNAKKNRNKNKMLIIKILFGIKPYYM